MLKSLSLISLFCFVILGCKSPQTNSVLHESPLLKIEKINDNTFLHISYIEYQGDIFDCNGLIYKKGNEVIILDAPNDDVAAKELIAWVKEELKTEIVAIVASHFHSDAYESMDVFREKGVNSYASAKTLELAEAENNVPYQNSFDGKASFMNGSVVTTHFGEGHTKDICVTYLKEEHILFGACLLKTLEAQEGYLGDANVEAWSNTVRAIKAAYPAVKIVVPGHGAYGDASLLDYTIELFEK